MAVRPMLYSMLVTQYSSMPSQTAQQETHSLEELNTICTATTLPSSHYVVVCFFRMYVVRSCYSYIRK